MAIILKDITELPAGTATLSNPIMFGIGELLHTATLEEIKQLILAGVITDIPPNRIKLVDIFPHATFDEDWEIDQLFAVAQAINYSLATFYGSLITINPGERIVFRLIQASSFSPEPGVLIPNVLWRYYSEAFGNLSFTGIVGRDFLDLIPNGVVRNIPDGLIDLGDIGMSSIEQAFNNSPESPFTMDGNSFVLAIQGGEPKIWKWIGDDGIFGGAATPAVSVDFLLLTQSSDGVLPTLQQVTEEGNTTTLPIIVKKGVVDTYYDGDGINRLNADTTDEEKIVFPPFIGSNSIMATREWVNSFIRANAIIGNRPEWFSDEWRTLAYNSTEEATGTVIDLSSVVGTTKNTPEWNATYTIAAFKVRGGNETRVIDTTGQTDFPDVTGSTIAIGSDFQAGKLFEMHAYTLDGVNVKHFFLILN